MVERFFEGGVEERIEGWIDRGRELGRDFVQDVTAPRTGVARRRRPLEAVSRRGLQAAADAPGWGRDDDVWPDDEVFNLPRWQRPEPPRPAPPDPLNSAPRQEERSPQRPLPRSSRRRPQR